MYKHLEGGFCLCVCLSCLVVTITKGDNIWIWSQIFLSHMLCDWCMWVYVWACINANINVSISILCWQLLHVKRVVGGFIYAEIGQRALHTAELGELQLKQELHFKSRLHTNKTDIFLFFSTMTFYHSHYSDLRGHRR